MDEEEEVRAIVEKLGKALNADLNRSQPIADCVRRLGEMGFDLTLYLEATLLLTKPGAAAGGRKPGTRPRLRRVRSGSLTLNERDVGFLKSLRISLQPPRRSRSKK